MNFDYKFERNSIENVSFMENRCGIKGVGLDIFRSYFTDLEVSGSLYRVLHLKRVSSCMVFRRAQRQDQLFFVYTHCLSEIFYSAMELISTFMPMTPISLERIKICIDDIRSCMIRNKLKIHGGNTEFLIMSSPLAICFLI